MRNARRKEQFQMEKETLGSPFLSIRKLLVSYPQKARGRRYHIIILYLNHDNRIWTYPLLNYDNNVWGQCGNVQRKGLQQYNSQSIERLM